MLLQPITLLFSSGTLKPSVYNLNKEGINVTSSGNDQLKDS